MQSIATPRPAAAATAPRRAAMAAIAGSNALAAWFGAIGLVTGSLPLGSDVEARLPLQSPVLAGAALAMIVAVPMTVLARLAWRGDARTDQQTMITGLLLVGWIGVQVAFIRTFSWFQPFYGVLGLVFVATADRRLRSR